MAKKTNRVLVRLYCPNCGRHNYLTEKNKINTPDKLVLKKFCPKCRKHTEHREGK